MRRILGRRVAIAVTVISTLAVAVPAVTGASATAGAVTTGPSDAANRAGMTTGPETLWESDADQNADYAAVAASGATWTTIDFDWNHIQSDGPGSFRWNAATDRAVLSARAHGLKIIAVAAYSPEWARRPDCPPGELHCFPADAADYARFVGAAAARYGSRSPDARLRGSVTVWSLWNEPNHQPFSMPKPDPDKYAAMVKSAYPAVKLADPTATVLTGGTAPAPDAPDGTEYQPSTWLEDLYQRGAGGSFDGVAHHPYSFPTNPLEAHDWNAFTQTQTLHDVMVAHGDGAKKIWGTEVGAPTGTDARAISEAQQAQFVRDYYAGWNTTFRSFTGPLVLFRLRDGSTDRSNIEDNFGLQYRDRTPKPAWAAYQAVTGVGGWQPLGGALASAPASASWGPNRVDVFATDSSGALIHKWGDGQTWSPGWENLGKPSGGLSGAPAVAAWGPNRLDVFAASSGRSLAHKWWDGTRWSAWENLGGRLASAPTVASWAAGRLDVFARAPGGALVHKFFGGGWSGWESLGGVLVGDPSAVSWGPDRVDVFVRGTDNGVWHMFFGGGWSGWESLGGTVTASPSAVSWGANRIDVFVRGTDKGLWHRWWDGARWLGFAPLGGGVTGKAAAVSDSGSRIDLFQRGADAQLWQRAVQ